MMACLQIGILLLLTAMTMGASSPGPMTANDLEFISRSNDAIYRLKYEEALRICDRAAAEMPGDPLPDVLRARVLWQREITLTGALELARFAADDFFVERLASRYRLDPDPVAETAFYQSSETAKNKALAMLRKNPNDTRARFLLGMAHRSKSTFDATFRGGWHSAFVAGDSARKAHERVERAHPDFHDAKLALAVYDYVAGSVGWFYKLCGYLLFIRGSRTRGLATLELVARDSQFSTIDAKVMLVLLYTREKRYASAEPLLQSLREMHPENCRVPLDQATLMLYQNRTADAIRIYQQSLRELRANPRGRLCPSAALLQTRIGIAHRVAGNLVEARAALEQAVVAEGHDEEKLRARLELGKVFDLLGNRGEAQKQYAQVRQQAERAAEREEAAAYLREPFRQGR
jgi:tetratricopeptide (TPR) repeat protein